MIDTKRTGMRIRQILKSHKLTGRAVVENTDTHLFQRRLLIDSRRMKKVAKKGAMFEKLGQGDEGNDEF